MKTKTLFEELQTLKQNAGYEEELKKIYIKHLGLKDYTLGAIDLKTDKIWFESKINQNVYDMFTQLLFYVNQANKKGEFIPPFLCVFDIKKAALMETKSVMELFEDKKIKWGKSASERMKERTEQVSVYIGTHFVKFDIEHHEEEFKTAIKTAIEKGEIIRKEITPDNLKIVFDKWMESIGKEIQGELKEEDYAALFYADIMHNGTNAAYKGLFARLLHEDGKACFLIHGKLLQLGSSKGYDAFWQIYKKPPKEEYRNYLLSRRDSLIPLNERQFKGAYYTPLHVVEKAYNQLTEALGKNWQKNYIVWDMCCGVGNLETKHSNPRNIFMSTLDEEDISIMRSSKILPGTTKFQYDYLNDDINEKGEIDYSLSKKLPCDLKEGKENILILMNPPYAEAGSGANLVGKNNKKGVAKTQVAKHMMEGFGKASSELFTQFLVRIQKEMPKAKIAMFSTLKHINAPNFEDFRAKWQAKFLGGFITHSKAFDGLKGNFPIGFLIWDTAKKEAIEEIEVEMVDKKGESIGQKKFFNIPKKTYLNVWFKRPRANPKIKAIPLKNAISVYTGKVRVEKWSDGALGYMYCGKNDLQHAGQQTALFSSSFGNGDGFYVNPENLLKASVVFAVRRLIKPTWMNDRDQFLQPNIEPLPREFELDCLIWMLFHGSNLSAGTNGLEYDEEKWSLINHFIPFFEEDVVAPSRFESHFMADFLSDKELSKEATSVLLEGKKIWQDYFKSDFEYKVRNQFGLNREDVGWYQIRNALKENEGYDFDSFKEAYDALKNKLSPLVYDYGFLKD